MIDPERNRPAPTTCYLRAAECTHDRPGWRHATSWEEVEEWLANDLEVIDQDGDKIVAVHPNRSVVNLAQEGSSEYHYEPHQILIEDLVLTPPATPEEEDEAMRSIMEAFNKRRLS
jgi:hypothetical protein